MSGVFEVGKFRFYFWMISVLFLKFRGPTKVRQETKANALWFLQNFNRNSFSLCEQQR